MFTTSAFLFVCTFYSRVQKRHKRRKGEKKGYANGINVVTIFFLATPLSYCVKRKKIESVFLM